MPIPDRIADKLRGKDCRNFDDLRSKIWEEVSKDPELNKQLDEDSQKNVKKGNAAEVPDEKQHVGKRRKYEIHHKKFIKNGGPALDMDNLSVVTPRRHVDLHRKR